MGIGDKWELGQVPISIIKYKIKRTERKVMVLFCQFCVTAREGSSSLNIIYGTLHQSPQPQIIVDNWNPRGKRECRVETFCCGLTEHRDSDE